MGTTRRLSIFLLARSLETGGAERQLVQLARGLHERGHSVQVGVFYKCGPLITELEQTGIRVVDLAKKGRWHLLSFVFRVRKEVAMAQADVLYSFLGGANLIAAGVRMLIPRLKLVWSFRTAGKDFSRFESAAHISFRAERALARLADLIIANSSAGRSFAISAGFPSDRIEVVPNGIDTHFFRPEAELRRRQREQWALSTEQIAIGMLARFDLMKGYDTFVRAAAQLLPQLPSAKFVCIGEGNELPRIQSLADELGIAEHIIFPGRTDEAVSALNGLDIYCSASEWEGFSNSIAEAMACGLSCVVTDVGDSARILGDWGTLVPPKDPNALAEGILREVQNLSQHDSMLARSRIVEEFAVDRMVERTLILIRTVCEPRGRIWRGKVAERS